MMKFSIVSLNWNGKRYLGELLDRHMKSLLNINYDNFEIIFVDNGSTDGSADYIKTRYHDARLKVIRLRRNFGYAKGNNLGAMFAGKDSDVLIFVNTDTILHKDCLKELAKVFADPKVGIAQPLLLDLDTGMIQYMGGYADYYGRTMTIGSSNNKYINNVLWQLIRHFKFRPLHILWAYGACIAVRKTLFDQIGGFNELFKFSHEEQTLCIPITGLGFDVVLVPKSVVYHKGSATIKYLKLSTEHTYNRFLFIMLYYPLRGAPKALIGRFLLELNNSLRLHDPITFFRVLIKTLTKLKLIVYCRKKSPKLLPSPFLTKSSIFLTKNHYVSLTIDKLLEVNRIALNG